MARLRHIAITVPDPEKAAEFYERTLGLKRVGTTDWEGAHGVYLTDGVMNLALLHYRKEIYAGRLGTGHVGVHHFGFIVADVAATREAIEAAGGEHWMGEPAEGGGFYEVKYFDPDGIAFDITANGWAGTDEKYVLQPSIERPGGLDEVKSLLAACRLPTKDVGEHVRFLVARENGRLIGVAGIEQFGASGLLRSVAVHPQWRRKGIAHALCGAVVRDAHERGVRRVFLLTTDAQRYFARLGFSVIERSALPEDVQNTAQFRDLCPQTAVAMTRVL